MNKNKQVVQTTRMAEANQLSEIEIVRKLLDLLNNQSLSSIETYWLLEILQDCMDNSYLTPEVEHECESLLNIGKSTATA